MYEPVSYQHESPYLFGYIIEFRYSSESFFGVKLLRRIQQSVSRSCRERLLFMKIVALVVLVYIVCGYAL